MGQPYRRALWLVCAFALAATLAQAKNIELKNALVVVEVGEAGLASVKNLRTGAEVGISADGWSLDVDGDTLKSSDAKPTVERTGPDEVTLIYVLPRYTVEAIYRLQPGWSFAGKQLRITKAPREEFTVHHVAPMLVALKEGVSSHWIPSTYLAQFNASVEQSERMVPAKDFGAFLRLENQRTGVMLLVQNPYLDVQIDGRSTDLAYSPEMHWQQRWGNFETDMACIAAYPLSGHYLAQAMVPQWKLPGAKPTPAGADFAEIAAFQQCVHSFLIHPPAAPIDVEVGWTMNDYQIDVGTPQGRAEYKRIIDTTSELGIRTLLYAPSNSSLSNISDDTDSWHWEHTLWLNLGQKIRKGEWDPAKSPIPADLTEMIAYAKKKNIRFLAYVYPSIPYEQERGWLVSRGDMRYATLASRDLQDYLIHDLLVFKERTGIAGYSFDYTWLDLPGSSSYAQWWGWRRVMQALRRADPGIVMDGRQSYQEYGPWSWLAGSYPHPTGNDEQPESFLPYPDLHFDRVSADRMRYVNYWYRNYQFAPEELIPGYATHQTERSRNIPPDSVTGGHPERVKMMETAYRLRDWDYLGYRYSFLSSIATGGWNNVVDMIPARDLEEFRHFSAADKGWIRDWLSWTVENKLYLQHTRTILGQPAMGRVDGTSAILGDHGYLFLFNPNYKAMPASFHLDSTIGLTGGKKFLLRELYPQKGRLLGKAGAGEWSIGDTVRLALDGTSATALEIVPIEKFDAPVIFGAGMPNSATNHAATASFANGTLTLEHISGEPGTDQEIGALLPAGDRVRTMMVDGTHVQPEQSGDYVGCHLHFEGVRFAQAQQVVLQPSGEGDLRGTFIVPHRIFEQLANRQKDWPIPWTKEDYQTTWLAPQRLLLFIQVANPKDTMEVNAVLDGKTLLFKRAYSSVRVHAADFVGFYADLSTIRPDSKHTLEIKTAGIEPGQLQGAFFDNVEPQMTEKISTVQ